MASESLNEYHDKLTSEFKTLSERLNKADSSGEIIDVKTEIVTLKKEIESQAHLLPKYQLLSYSEQIQSLLDKVDARSKPQRRFKLNRDRTKSTPAANTVLKKVAVEPHKQEDSALIAQSNNEIIRISEKSKTLNNVTHSIIITVNEVESITMKDISNSVIVINSKGPAFLFSLKNCLVFVHCHQLRIHDTVDSKFVTDIPNKVGVIENSKSLKFNTDVDIKDFNHPFGVSPNYTYYEITQELINVKKQVENSPELSYLEKYIALV